MTHEHGNPDSTEQPAPDAGDDVAALVRRAGPRPVLPQASLDRMQAELRPLWSRQVARRPARRRRRWLAVAATLAAVALVALLGARLAAPPAAVGDVATVVRIDGAVSAWREGSADRGIDLRPGGVVAAGRTVATAPGARVALATAGGHSLRLDRDSRVVLLDPKLVRLEQGALYVDRAGGARVGLTVQTPLGRVEEIGTQFEVRLTADTLTVRVREGRVAMDAEGRPHDVVAGEELAVAGGRLRRRSIRPDDEAFAWTQSIAPTWRLDGSRLSGFLAWAARETGREVRFAAPELEREAREIVLRGEIEGLTPDQALEAVLPAVGLTHREIDGAWLVERLAGAAER